MIPQNRGGSVRQGGGQGEDAARSADPRGVTAFRNGSNPATRIVGHEPVEGLLIAPTNLRQKTVLQLALIAKGRSGVAEIGPGHDQGVLPILRNQLAQHATEFAQVHALPVVRGGTGGTTRVGTENRNHLECIDPEEMLQPGDLKLDGMLTGVIEFVSAQIATAVLKELDKRRVRTRDSQGRSEVLSRSDNGRRLPAMVRSEDYDALRGRPCRF